MTLLHLVSLNWSIVVDGMIKVRIKFGVFVDVDMM